MGWNKEDKWYSGQGVVLLADRGTDGKPKAFIEVGNCSSVKLSIKATTLDKKESKTGQRALTKRMTTQTDVMLSVTMDSYRADNLAIAMRGKKVVIAGEAVTGEAVKGYQGGISALAHISVSSVAIKQSATALTLYTNDTTPYDYKLNPEGGSFQINDGSVVALDKFGVVVTAAVIGATTTLTVPNTASVGDTVTLRGFTGVDAADLNGKTFTLTAATAANITFALVSTGKTYTTTANTRAVFSGGTDLTADYTFADQVRVDALVDSSKEVFVRFEGLNTAENNEPVLIEIFRFNPDPLKDLELISDQFQQFQLEGPALQDSTRTVGSNFYQVTKLGTAITA